jgi:hypothetical protein
MGIDRAQWAAQHRLAVRERDAIVRFYGERAATRSRVPLMNHIDEGLLVLDRIGASELARRAYCLHPLVQEDAELAASWSRIAELTDEPRVLVLVMEYRNIANATLSTREIASAAEIVLSPLADVNAMLVADKIQNYKDFIAHHRATHPRGDALERYFRLWLERLGVGDMLRDELFAAIDQKKRT